MKIEITIEHPVWNKNENIKDKWKCVFVRFENQQFVWIPTYRDVISIMENLIEAEKQNRRFIEGLNAPDPEICDKVFSCQKCGWSYRRPTLSGRCPKCGDELIYG